MELQQWPKLPFIFTFLLFLFMVIKKIKKSASYAPSSVLLPPGPSKLPFIGHLHHLLGLPHRKLKDLANIHGPLMHLKLGEVSTVVVSSPALAKLIMKTHELKFLDRPFSVAADIMTYGCKDIIMAPYGEFWRQVRKICILELLSPKRVQSFLPVREEEVMKLIARISCTHGAPLNISDSIFTVINDITVRQLFGKNCKDKQAFISEMKEVVRLSSGFALPDLFPSLKLEVISGLTAKLQKIHQKVDKMLDKIIREHQANRMAMEHTIKNEVDEDIVDVLLRLQRGDLDFDMTIDNVKAVTYDMFAAGSNSSAIAIEWAFAELLRNPRVMEKAQAEVRQILHKKTKVHLADINKLKYLRLVIKESLRIHPPAPLLIPRECRERCEIEGYEIPKGMKVIVNAWAIGRDPNHWIDPETFMPERFQDESTEYNGTDFKYIPFGAGRRICPAILFGVANIELPLALLLYHFDWKLADGGKPEDLDMTEALSLAVRRKHDLYVICEPYNPS